MNKKLVIKKSCMDCVHCVLISYREAGQFNMGEWICTKFPPHLSSGFQGIESGENGIENVRINGQCGNVDNYIGHRIVEKDSFCSCFKMKDKQLRLKIAKIAKRLDVDE